MKLSLGTTKLQGRSDIIFEMWVIFLVFKNRNMRHSITAGFVFEFEISRSSSRRVNLKRGIREYLGL